jgi:STE24 endopeptidase
MDPAAATKAWLDSVPAEKRAKSDAYFEGGYWLILWNFLLGAAIMFLFLTAGISVRLRTLAERITRVRLLQSLLYAIPFLLLALLLSFPLTIYQDFIRDHAYGLSTQSFPSWLRDQMTNLAVAMIALSILIVVLYVVFRHATRSWWLWAAGVVTLFSIIVTMIAPVYIAPLTNKYKPLADAAIRDPILRMARANEIPVDQVYEFDASRQTNRISANVSGFLGTTRISLNDNLLTQCSLPEIRAVMAHEMGHYVLNHSVKLVMYSGILTFLSFAVTRWMFNALMARWGDQWQLRGIADPAALPLLVVILATISFLLTPLNNSIIRITEREADAFEINTAREPDGMAKIALKLGSYRKLDPGPVEEIIFFDHPSGRARIRMAMDWKAANLPAN